MPKRPTEHHAEQLLEELTELSMGLARQAAARVDKAETLDEIEAAVRDFERLTEDVCASIALRRKLQADREAALHDLERELAESLAEEMDGPRVLH